MRTTKSEDIRRFIWEMEKQEKSPLTIRKYHEDIRQFFRYLKDGEEVTKEKMISYKKELLKTYAVSSTNSKLAAVNSFLTYTGKGDCRVRPVKVQKRIFANEKKELTHEEYIKLIEVCQENGSERLSLIIQTICSTGIRIGELDAFTLQAAKQGKIEAYNKGKARVILLPEKLKEKLLKYAKKKNIVRGQIFVTKNNVPVNRSNIWAEMKKMCEKAGIAKEKVFPHNLRHLFARTYYDQEKDITKLADLLGHSSIETTRIYVMTTGKEHKEQLSHLNLII